jgi:hypothetical protein
LSSLTTEGLPSISKVNPPLNLLYVLGPASLSKWRNNEIRYSLRSFDPFNVAWVGITGPYLPIFLTGVTHISVPHQEGGNRYQQTQRQILAACSDERVPEDIVLLNDDFMVRSLDTWNWTPTHRGNVLPRKTPNAWKQSIIDTTARYGPINYEGHTPFQFSKSKAKPLLEEILQAKEILQFKTAYGNVNSIGGQKQPNAKRDDPDKWPANFPFWSLASEPSEKAKRFLQRWLTKPSRWEI